ncbi:hypothetical protein [Nostoc sp. NMS8]|uniref:hypothetical protein n=1 Tax=Nostoc sp. NMS8 TaxID=2815392 RepID=UPI0025EBC796|nr:hypothetical protein [Nostoc sp. NMS8]
MKNYFFQAAKIFFNPETLVPFIIGTIFLSVLGNALNPIEITLKEQFRRGKN